MGVNRKLGIDSLSVTVFPGGTLYLSANYMIFIKTYGINAQILASKKGKYTFLYTDIFFFRLFPQFKTEKNLFSSKKIYLSYLKPV